MTPKSLKLFSIFFVLSALFVLSMFYRVSNAVIAPNLIQDLKLSAQTLGILGGAYFYSFAILQIPVGPMLDRIGPRIIISSFSLIGALGAFLFASGESLTAAFLGRILIGVGMASVLMGAMKIFVLRFPPEKFATLVGILLSVGTLGNIFATSPLAFLTSAIGWRMTFIFAGGMTALFAFLIFWVLGGEMREAETFPSPLPKPEITVLQSMRMILKSLAFWQIGAVAFFRYGTFVALQGLWLGPYLMEIKGYSPVQTGNVLILLAIGMIVGGPIAGRLSDRTFRSRKGVALGGLSLYCVSLFLLIGVLKIQAPFWYALIFFFIGFFGSFGMLIYSHAKDLFPAAISGTVMTLVNFFTMAGAAVFMPVLGKIIESFPRTNHAYPAEAYHFSFLICFLGMSASVIFYAFSRQR
ncbi:MAG: MFS transporter [Thermodesulfobacteriota bacterium]|nr:MFS transporter [Thermodesulfobacteriota bacterium]